MDSYLPIFLASDETYAPFVTTTMYSILRNTESNVKFTIIDGGIMENTKRMIHQSLEEFNHFTLHYVDIKNFSTANLPSIKTYTKNAFSRYFIPNIDENTNKAIYLDADIIAVGDIQHLFDEDLEGFPLGAILEDFFPENYTYLKKRIALDYNGDDHYFNSGVLLIDCEAFRRHDYTSHLLEITQRYEGKLSTADQDCFNIVFENNFKVLKYRYNFMPDFSDSMNKWCPEEYDLEKDNVILYHFTNGKPWKYESQFSHIFFDVLKYTKFYNSVFFTYSDLLDYKIFTLRKLGPLRHLSILYYLNFFYQVKH